MDNFSLKLLVNCRLSPSCGRLTDLIFWFHKFETPDYSTVLFSSFWWKSLIELDFTRSQNTFHFWTLYLLLQHTTCSPVRLIGPFIATQHLFNKKGTAQGFHLPFEEKISTTFKWLKLSLISVLYIARSWKNKTYIVFLHLPSYDFGKATPIFMDLI